MSGKNRFNNITSKEWLPFQKSWIKDVLLVERYRSYIRFFVKFDLENNKPYIYYSGDNLDAFNKIAKQEGAIVITNIKDIEEEQKLQLVIIDLLDINKIELTKKKLIEKRDSVLELIKIIKPYILDRRFLTIFCRNYQIENKYLPFSWELSEYVSQLLSLKDEKIWCRSEESKKNETSFFKTLNNINYLLHFRKDENNGIDYGLFKDSQFYKRVSQDENNLNIQKEFESFKIIKPIRRNKTEILHPAKYPEEIVKLFVEIFSKKRENVFDPMSGTGSTQLGALMLERNGYGTELSSFFSKIAIKRLEEFIEPNQIAMFSKDRSHLKHKILNIDAKDIRKEDFPVIDL